LGESIFHSKKETPVTERSRSAGVHIIIIFLTERRIERGGS
jgi:hypothetical protein